MENATVNRDSGISGMEIGKSLLLAADNVENYANEELKLEEIAQKILIRSESEKEKQDDEDDSHKLIDIDDDDNVSVKCGTMRRRIGKTTFSRSESLMDFDDQLERESG